jgi:hypothetical protein
VVEKTGTLVVEVPADMLRLLLIQSAEQEQQSQLVQVDQIQLTVLRQKTVGKVQN